MRVNLGCGLDVLPGWVNVDIVPIAGAEQWDLEEMPWAWAEDGTVDEIRAIDVFEHIMPPARIGFMTECHRILRPGGSLHIQTSRWGSWTAVTDPTHWGAGFTERTFDYWIPGTEFYQLNAMYGGVSFERVRIGPSGNQLELDVWLRRPDVR